MKYTLIQKAWEINRDKLNEGFLYSEMVVYAENKNKAKYKLLSKYRYEINLKYSDDEISYINIPVIRCPNADKYLFEEQEKTIWQIDEILHERKRIFELDLILCDDMISHCYIRKGYYYNPNSSGYTAFINKAGVYTKQDAVSKAKSCSDLTIIPINIEEHNKMINDEINDLKTRIINVPKYHGKGLMQQKIEELHLDYMQRIKSEDPILYSELTSDPTGTGSTNDFSRVYLFFIIGICFLIWFFVFLTNN